MMRLLPTEILDSVNLKGFNLDQSKDSPIGCSLEVYLDYPNELHDLQNYYPLTGKNRTNKRNVVQKSITNHKR